MSGVKGLSFLKCKYNERAVVKFIRLGKGNLSSAMCQPESQTSRSEVCYSGLDSEETKRVVVVSQQEKL